jgi:hypothetical protein
MLLLPEPGKHSFFAVQTKFWLPTKRQPALAPIKEPGTPPRLPTSQLAAMMLARLRQSHFWQELELMRAPISTVEQTRFPLQTRPPRPAVSKPMLERQPRRAFVAMTLVLLPISWQGAALMLLLPGQQKPSSTVD